MDATSLAGELLAGAPANVTLGIRVLEAVDGRAVVSLDVSAQLTNVIGSLHASALAGLVDASGLAALVSAFPDAATARTALPLGRAAQLRFLAPARGVITASCALDRDTHEQVARLGRGQKARISTDTTITSGDAVVATGSFEWSVRLAS